MSEIDDLLRAYQRFVALRWDPGIAGAQKVWFAIYEPPQERRLRLRLPDFATATRQAGHDWHQVDLTDSFARWMATHDYRDDYFQQPELLDMALSEFTDRVADEVCGALSAPAVRGRLLVFFPGRRDASNYRLLDAHDGWNYLAVPISARDGE